MKYAERKGIKAPGMYDVKRVPDHEWKLLALKEKAEQAENVDVMDLVDILDAMEAI